MNKLFYISFFGILLFSINACKKETETVNLTADANYFPDDSGTYVIYKVDSILYNDFFYNSDPSQYLRSSSYFLKEKITEQFTDNRGRKSRKIERFISDDTTLHPFDDVTNVWYFVKTERSVEKVEDNIRYVKLTFPVSTTNEWKGNKYFLNEIPFLPLKNSNVKFDWNYAITEKDVAYTNTYLVFDSTLTVLQIADSSKVNKLFSEERYARNVGLVDKELWRLDAQPVDGQPFLGSKLNGFIYKQTAIRYGKE
jgi:hypothetical protein